MIGLETDVLRDRGMLQENTSDLSSRVGNHVPDEASLSFLHWHLSSMKGGNLLEINEDLF